MYAYTRILTTVLASYTLLATACDPAPAGESAAAEATDDAVNPAQLGLGDDWVLIQDGLWTRADAEGDQEFAAIGEAGTPHAIAKLEEVELELLRALETFPSEENRENLAVLREHIADLSLSPLTVDLGDVSFRCHVTSNGTAVAQPSACGVSATATAIYANTCNSNLTKSLNTYALAQCNGETKTHSCGRTGNPVNCSSSVSLTGSGPCYSYASFQIPGATVWKDNSTRGACGGGPTPSTSVSGGGGGGSATNTQQN